MQSPEDHTRPGDEPAHWTSAAKQGVGTAFNFASQVWFTLGRGILNEVYYPRVDVACVREMGLVVADGRAFVSDEAEGARHEVAYPRPGAPAYRLTNTCTRGRYRIEKTVFANPRQHAILQVTRFEASGPGADDLRLYAHLAPHLGNQGAGNTAWAADHKGTTLLFAERGGYALALACSLPWRAATAAHVDGAGPLDDLRTNKRLTRLSDRAEDGNVALAAEIDLGGPGGPFVLALGLGRTPAEAAFRARSSLIDDPEALLEEFAREWLDWQGTLLPLEDAERTGRDLYRLSAAVLRSHESKSLPGGIIASLSVPWGFARGDRSPGGYHLVWPRDEAEAAGGLLAAGAHVDAHRMLAYLQATQEADGHWAQNMWVDGAPYWDGIQLDEAALPVLFVNLLDREKLLRADDRARFWPMVRRAAGYIVRNGPATEQDRWEKDGGYTPFTIAAEVAALLAAADLAAANGEPGLAEFLREVADAWNGAIETWLYARDTPLSRQFGVEGHYIRIVSGEASDNEGAAKGDVSINNRPRGDRRRAAVDVVSPDALALVRFGLRKADDPRILNTLKVIDGTLRVETPSGPCWRRYTFDAYGEHDDGTPYSRDRTSLGRPWPLLTGERAHYELAAGRRDEAARLLRAIEGFAGDGGMIPEQVWDAADIPERGLFFGRPTGSAMPLAWAHAEYIKLRRSLRDGRVFDMPPQTVERYLWRQTPARHTIWRFSRQVARVPDGRALRLLLEAPAHVRYTGDGWKTAHALDTRDTGIGLHVADLPAAAAPAGGRLEFTFHWPSADRWEGRNFSVAVPEAPARPAPEPRKEGAPPPPGQPAVAPGGRRLSR